MLRNGRTGHTWHLVVDHIMLVMKMRSSSPVNRLVGLYRGFMCMYKKRKTKTKKNKKKKWLVTAGCLQQLEKAGCKWLSSKKKKRKGKKKKVLLIGYFAYYIPLWDQCMIICAFLQDYTVSH